MQLRHAIPLLVFALLLGCSQHEVDYCSWTNNNLAVGIPSTDCQVVDKEGYALGWSKQLKQPLWVQHVLTAEEASATNAPRSNAFKVDPSVECSSTPSDYARSGYDKGHLAPAADMHWSQQAMDDSFFMSNMSPQTPMLNRQLWAKLESWTRKQAKVEQCVIVVSGPICTNSSPKKIGKSGVVVPDAFFKVVLDATPPCKVAAFIAPNLHSSLSSDIYSCTSTVDEVEALSRLQLLPKAFKEDVHLQKSKSSSDISAWTNN